MRKLLLTLGFLALAVGLLWIGQGTGAVKWPQSSFMISQIQWAGYGAALAALPEPQRRALTLAYFGGYSQAEIAQLTGTPLGTVKTRTLAALRRLRAVLDDTNQRAGIAEREGT